MPFRANVFLNFPVTTSGIFFLANILPQQSRNSRKEWLEDRHLGWGSVLTQLSHWAYRSWVLVRRDRFFPRAGASGLCFAEALIPIRGSITADSVAKTGIFLILGRFLPIALNREVPGNCV